MPRPLPSALSGFSTDKITTTSKRSTQYDNVGLARKHFFQAHPAHGESRSIILSYDSWDHYIDLQFFHDFLPEQSLSTGRDLDITPETGQYLLRHPQHDNIFSSIKRGKQLIHYLDYWLNKLPHNTGNDGFGYDYKHLRAEKPTYSYTAEIHKDCEFFGKIKSIDSTHFEFSSDGSLKRGRFKFYGVGINHNEPKKKNEFNLEFKFAFVPEGSLETLKSNFHNDTHHTFEIRLNMHFSGIRARHKDASFIQDSADLTQMVSRKLDDFKANISTEIGRVNILNLSCQELDEAISYYGVTLGRWLGWSDRTHNLICRTFELGYKVPQGMYIYVPYKQKSLSPHIKRTPLPPTTIPKKPPTNQFIGLAIDDVDDDE